MKPSCFLKLDFNLKFILIFSIEMKLLLRPIQEGLRELYSHHAHYNQGDSGLDLFFPEDVTLHPGDRGVLIDFGIQCEAITKNGLNPLSYYLYPRSSISKTPLRMANSVGIIDSGYRGNIIVALDHIGTEPFDIQKGTRLYQICSPTLDSIHLQITDTLSGTDRGGNGFGSTGS